MIQICFEVICFNADAFLEPVLESIIPFAPVIAVEGPVKYFRNRGYVTSTDRTNEILHDLLPEQMIVHGQFDEKDDEVNAALSRIPKGTTHIFAVDADEVWKENDLKKVFALLECYQYDSMSFRFNTFYGGFDRVLRGFEYEFENHRIQRFYEGAKWDTHRPPTILTPSGTPWREHNHLNHIATSNLGIEIQHYSYVFPKQVKSKIAYYESWGAGVIPNYFENVYLKWVTANDYDKKRIEQMYRGVHEWLPERRGDCFTEKFTGEHPQVIQKRMSFYRERFARELAELSMQNEPWLVEEVA